MRKLYCLPILLGLLSLGSCTTYQYVTVKSDLAQTTDSKHYYFEQDSIYVDFDFSGRNFPVSMYIENMGSKPLFLDLQRSIFLMDGQVLRNAMPSKKTEFSGFVNYNGEINGDTADSPMQLRNVFLPKNSHLLLRYQVFPFSFNKWIINSSSYKSTVYNGVTTKVPHYDIKVAGQNNYTILLRFSRDESFENDINIEATFRPEQIFTTSMIPENFPLKGPNVFYTVEPGSNAGAGLAALNYGLMLAVILAASTY